MAYDVNFQVKVFPALTAAFDEYLAPIYSGRLFTNVPGKTPTYPVCVYQSQDRGGRRADTIERNGWNGLITFRSIDLTQSGAWNKALELSEALPLLTASGFIIEYMPEHPMWMPVENITAGNIYTAALVVQFLIYKDLG
jgi:hypothetical protein